MSRASALYARFSSDVQNPSSASDQLARLRDYLGRVGQPGNGMLEFSDEGVSGSVWHARPGVQALLKAIKERKVSAVYAESLDRISRDPGDLYRFRKLLKHYGVDFVSVADGMKLDGSTGSAMVFMMKSFTAEQSVRDTADKSQRGLRANAAQGRTTGGTLYGYARTKIGESKRGTAIRRYEVDPEQATVVRRVFQDYASGLGYGAIAAALNAEGIAPPRGKQRASTQVQGWAGSCLREMLRNPKYAGRWVFGVREWGRDPETERRVVRKRRDASDPADRERLVETNRPELVIVSAELWDRVQARLARHQERYERREISDRKSAYLLSGLLRCGACGALMQIAGGNVPRYRCSANAKRGASACANALSVREHVLREGIVGAIAECMSQPSTLTIMKRRVAEHLRQAAEKRDERLARAERERTEVEARITRTEARLKSAHLRRLDGEGDDVLDGLIRELRAELQEAKARLAQLQADAAPSLKGPSAKELDEVTRYICGLSFLNELDQEFDDGLPLEVRVAEMREALRKLMKHGAVVLEPDAAGRVYTAKAILRPLALLDKTRTPGEGARAYDDQGCAGTQLDMSYVAEFPVSVSVAA